MVKVRGGRIVFLLAAILVAFVALGYSSNLQFSPPDTGISSSSCTDSDGGENYDVRGKTCIPKKSLTFEADIEPLCLFDVCVDASRLQEYYCQSGKRVSRIVNCNYGCQNGQCLPEPEVTEYRVFVSSQTFDGNLGGIAQADAHCQSLAEAASLGGTGAWKAWLSDSTTNAIDRLDSSAGNYTRIDGTLVAADLNDLTDGNILAPIEIDEFGSVTADSVITGTNELGISTGNNCNDWTSSEGTGTKGVTTETDAFWTNFFLPFSCGDTERIYCFEQPA